MDSTLSSSTWPIAGWTPLAVTRLELALDNLRHAETHIDMIYGQVIETAHKHRNDAGFDRLRDVLGEHHLEELIEALDVVLYAKGDQGAADHRILVGHEGMHVGQAIAELASYAGPERVRALLVHHSALRGEAVPL